MYMIATSSCVLKLRGVTICDVRRTITKWTWPLHNSWWLRNTRFSCPWLIIQKTYRNSQSYSNQRASSPRRSAKSGYPNKMIIKCYMSEVSCALCVWSVIWCSGCPGCVDNGQSGTESNASHTHIASTYNRETLPNQSNSPPLVHHHHQSLLQVSAVDQSLAPPVLISHETLMQCCFNVGPLSATVAQHWNNIGSTTRASSASQQTIHWSKVGSAS